MAFGRVASMRIGPEGQQGVDIEGLRFAFSITKTDLQSANEAHISVYNLSDNTLGIIDDENVVLVFRAGYEDEGGAKGLFWGLVEDLETTRSSPDFETRINAYDGARRLDERYVTLSFRGGVSIERAADAAIDALGLPLGNERPISGRMPGGFSFSGLATDALSTILDEAGLTWSVQNELLYIYAEGENVEPQALRLTKDTGLIGPVVDVSRKGERRWMATSLLYPELVPGAIVRIESREATGMFVIERSDFRGDTHQGEFAAEIEVREV